MCRNGLLTLIAILILATTRQDAAAGDPEAGAHVFQTCAACHTLEPGVHRTGPSLAGVFGREAGTAEGFHRYSQVLRTSELIWHEDSEVTSLLALWRDRSRASAEVKQLAQKRIGRVERKIEDPQMIKRVLLDLAERCQGDDRPDCPHH